MCPQQFARAEPPRSPIVRGPETIAAIAYRPTPAEDRLLDDIERGCFEFFWHEVGAPAGLVKDRRKADVCSVAAVGFQLASLPIGVERGWIQREQGRARARGILSALWSRTDNRKYGILLHFVDQDTGGVKAGSPEIQTSTVDHALFAAGAMVAGEYFGGEIAEWTDRFLAAADWRAHLSPHDGLISFGWKGTDPVRLDGDGEFLPLTWKWASDEERIIYFLAAGAPHAPFRVDPAAYYRTARSVGRHAQMDPFVISWNGSLFTYFFSHCWIDYVRFSREDPHGCGVDIPPVDWLENSRRAVLTQRQRCMEAAPRFATLGENRWGLSPCMGFRRDGSETYHVPELRPSHANRDEWCEGTVAPYAAAAVIHMTPRESLAALKEFRELQVGGKALAWEDPAKGGYGFADSFNLDQGKAQFDLVGIDVGPMLVAIENYRSGQIWKLFHQHPVAKRAVAALRMGEATADSSPATRQDAVKRP